MGTALAIPEVLRSLGADPAEVLAEMGLDLSLFGDPEHRISVAAHNRIFSHCVKRTGCEHFGLLVGQRDGLHSFGLIGLLVKYSSNVERALTSFIRHFHHHAIGATVSLAREGNSAMLTWHIHEPGIDAIDQVGDGALAVLYNIMLELCGPDWRPNEVWFAHRRPVDVVPFRRFFQAPLRFDAEMYALLFASSCLQSRIPVADHELQRTLQVQVDALEERYPHDFPEQVRGMLRTALETGRFKAGEIASLFSMHSRTLHRRLAEHGLGYRQLLDESRFELAKQLLEDSTLEVGQIAELLGYAAPGAFTRAFLRWSKATPAEWRAAHRSRM